jgi:hypothetical protein
VREYPPLPYRRVNYAESMAYRQVWLVKYSKQRGCCQNIPNRGLNLILQVLRPTLGGSSSSFNIIAIWNRFFAIRMLLKGKGLASLGA